MNVFATYSDPLKSAQYLDDQRVVKMILESVQMLSTASSSVGKWHSSMTRPLGKAHYAHPCAIWARQNRVNYQWLLEHAIALDAERRRRWSRDMLHRSLSNETQHRLAQTVKYLPYADGIMFVNAARHAGLNLDFTSLPVHKAYRQYLKARWMIQTRPAKCTIP